MGRSVAGSDKRSQNWMGDNSPELIAFESWSGVLTVMSHRQGLESVGIGLLPATRLILLCSYHDILISCIPVRALHET
jgi:hypothetical protein